MTWQAWKSLICLRYDSLCGAFKCFFVKPASGEQTQILLAENTKAVEQREQEITQIVRSIHELNEIFRDVAQLVVDQVSNHFISLLFS